MKQKIFVLLTLLLFSTASHAATANCKIEIQDVLKGTIYTVEQKFTFEYGAITGQRKHFDVPGNDYSCTLTFFELHKGTMLSCEYTKDLGHTFFQSDRSPLNDETTANNLSFRHKSAFIAIKSICK